MLVSKLIDVNKMGQMYQKCMAHCQLNTYIDDYSSYLETHQLENNL